MSNDYDDDQPRATGIDSPNNTYFEPSDAPANENKYERLWRWNQGLWKSRNRVDEKEVWRQDRLNVLDSIASELELTDWQKEEAQRTLESVNLTDTSVGQTPRLEASCFCICAFTFNEDVHPEREDSCIYLPHKEDENNPDHFIEAKNELGLSDTELSTALEQLRKAFASENDA